VSKTVRMRRMRRLLAALLVTGALTAAVFAATASAEYGPGAVYQVEISANAQPGPSFGSGPSLIQAERAAITR
jgi:peptidoglycan/LPS O-acetylase OafA/YrhL